MKNKIDYSLYLCTDRKLMSTDTVEEAVEQAILGGCTIIQLREKDCSSSEFYETAVNVKKITHRYNIPLIINDRVDIALAVDAEGVHVGQSDLPCSVVRKIIGEDKIIGVSASTLDEAVKAEKDGADYLGVGAMYSTNTKADADIVTIEELKKIRKTVKIPIVVIGGINRNTLGNFKGCGIDGVAVVSAIISQKDIRGAAQELLQKFKGEYADGF
jgi:thiamine-phosphate pyrophosphorylase